MKKFIVMASVIAFVGVYHMIEYYHGLSTMEKTHTGRCY